MTMNVAQKKFVLFVFFSLASIWFKILKHIDIVNKATQIRGEAIDIIAKYLRELINDLEHMRDNDWNRVLNECKEVAKNTGWADAFKSVEKRGRKRKRFFDDDEQDEDQPDSSPESVFEQNVFHKILSSIISDMQARFEQLEALNDRFSILWLFKNLSDDDITEQATTLQEFYEGDIDIELVQELKQLKILYTASFGTNMLGALDLLNSIHQAGLSQLFPNIVIALRIFLTIPASVASAERSFSVLKRVKNVLRSTMAQGRLSSLGVLAVETEMARTINIEGLIDRFVEMKSRKAFFA